ncbi:MAG: hypothetical protein M0C28_34985 [Candidatus Moduliflexus flocculans]|nr:hypothetical protein [Candidatus Moduliflexus flocculans]
MNSKRTTPAEAASIATIGGLHSANTTRKPSSPSNRPRPCRGDQSGPNWCSNSKTCGLTVYYLGNPATLEEMYTNLETVAGPLAGHVRDRTGRPA